MSVRVWELIHTPTHTQMFWRSKKAQPDLQTSRLLLERRPSVFAKHPLGAIVNPFIWCGGLDRTPKSWHDMRSCRTTGLQLLHCRGLMTVLRRATPKLSSPGERLKKTTCVPVWKISVWGEGGSLDQLGRVTKMEGDLSLHHQCDGNHLAHLYKSDKMYD